MPYTITYLASNENQALKQRSIALLNNFFGEESYNFGDETAILFFASGGSEQKAKNLCEHAQHFILLCHRESNSYAAAIETAAYLRERGKLVSLINMLSPGAFDEFKQVASVISALKKLENQKAALIGEASDWLIASSIEPKIIKQKFGIELVQIPWEATENYKVKKPITGFFTHFKESQQEELQETAKVFGLLTEVIQKEQLTAVTVECFSMAQRDQVTACLPLAVLNEQNTVAACEGDISSMIGKMIIRALDGSIPWQANVANITEDSILFAHCTAPLNMLDDFEVTTHYETGIGTAIKGNFKKGKVGIFRINNQLDKYMLFEGEVSSTPSHSFACRTQIEVKTELENLTLIKEKALGNHHLIFPAKVVPLIVKMMVMLHVERIK